MGSDKTVMLTKIQIDTAKKIIIIGKKLNKSDAQIRTALKVAAIESSLGGDSRKNPKSSANGLYQYIDSTWKQDHAGKDRLNNDDAIYAFYEDEQKSEDDYFEHRRSQKDDPKAYAQRPQSRKVPENISLEEYIYIKHHDGRQAHTDHFVRDSNMDKGINYYHFREADSEEILKELYRKLATNPQDAPAESPPKAKASLLDYYKKAPALPPVGPSKDVDGTAVPSPSILDYYKDKPGGGGGHAGLVHVSGYMRGEVQVSDYERSWPDGDTGNNLGSRSAAKGGGQPAIGGGIQVGNDFGSAVGVDDEDMLA